MYQALHFQAPAISLKTAFYCLSPGLGQFGRMRRVQSSPPPKANVSSSKTKEVQAAFPMMVVI